jgi:hypothetical protein
MRDAPVEKDTRNKIVLTCLDGNPIRKRTSRIACGTMMVLTMAVLKLVIS